MSKLGNVFVISAASGSGKTSLVRALLRKDPNIRLSVSHTTRAPRGNEKNGEDYHFVDRKTFENMIGEGLFLEHARVHDHYYGTSSREVEKIREQGWDVVLEIDVQGAEQIRRLLPDSVGVFVLPPSFSVLSERLSGRATDSDDTIRLRLHNAREEFEQAFLFDYLVVNDDFEDALNNLWHIVRAERLAQTHNQDVLMRLLSECQTMH